MSAQPYFDALHADEDPFGYRSRWYEERKRALLMASLTQRRFQRGWELGCSNGVLTELLAARCEQMLATDISPQAILHARRTLAHLPHVQVDRAQHPQQWPEGCFDLIVCSEMGYYLAADALGALRSGVQAALRDGGLLLACHWLPPFAERASPSQQVHEHLGQGLNEVFCYRDSDFLLQGWTRMPLSLARIEGLR